MIAMVFPNLAIGNSLPSCGKLIPVSFGKPRTIKFPSIEIGLDGPNISVSAAKYW